MKIEIASLYHSFGGIACAGAVLLIAAGASAQNLYVSDYSNGSIYEITPTGTQSVFASGMSYPYGLAFNSAGDLFVANSDDNTGESGNITEITPNGTQSVFASSVDPLGLAFNDAGDLFEADYRSGNIYEYTPGGVRTTFASGFSLPLSLTFNSSGDLFVGAGWGAGNGYITEIAPNGIQSLFVSGLNFPEGLAANSAGDLFEADQGSGNVYEFTPDGAQHTLTSINGVAGLAFDNAGDLFMASGFGSVTEITAEGQESTIASFPGDSSQDQLAFQPVPEPSVAGLIGVGATALILRRRTGNA
jgi:sugar lactone lactonase YvrE